jgi:probable phosphoglycerate mutase
MPTLLLVRHGQTEWNVQRRVLGRTDIALDETGRIQVSDLAVRLRPVTKVFTSPLTRARQTAHPVAAAYGLVATPVESLIEMDQGELEGLGEAELLERHGSLVRAWHDEPSGIRLPGGETMDEVADRAMAALGSIAAGSNGGRIAVITHQIVLSTALCRLQGLPLSHWRRFTHPNTAWAEVAWGPSPRVIAMKIREAQAQE